MKATKKKPVRHRIDVRFNRNDYRLVRNAAKKDKKNMSEFVRHYAVRVAAEVIPND